MTVLGDLDFRLVVLGVQYYRGVTLVCGENDDVLVIVECFQRRTFFAGDEFRRFCVLKNSGGFATYFCSV